MLDLRSRGRRFDSRPVHALLDSNSGQVVHTHVPLSPSSVIWYRSRGGDALRLSGLSTYGLMVYGREISTPPTPSMGLALLCLYLPLKPLKSTRLIDVVLERERERERERESVCVCVCANCQ